MDYPTTALPFAMPSADVFFDSPRKAFAHYFYPFPLSIDNKIAPQDYYNVQYLAPSGEKDKWLAQGGYLRQRPLSVNPQTGFSIQTNMQREVAMAISRGITGFFFDILSLADAISPTGHLQTLIKAAAVVDKRFIVVPMLDMSSLGAITSAQVLQIMQSIQNYTSLGCLPDGRIMLAAYNAQLQTEGWWQITLSLLNDSGIYVAFVPILPGGPSDAGSLNPISYAVGGWGTASPIPAMSLVTNVATALSKGLEYVMPVLTQQFRPKSNMFWECENSKTYRNSWMSAINGTAYMVQIVTWSDFSESGQVQPYTDASLDPRIGTGFFDLTAYFATWYATGDAPQITQDVLYFFYRKASSKVTHANQPNPMGIAPNEIEINNIEVLAFLSAPGVVNIAVGNTSSAFNAGYGLNVFNMPSMPGIPKVSLSRNGSKVLAFTGPVQIYGPEGLPSGLIDMTYWSGSATIRGITQYNNT